MGQSRLLHNFRKAIPIANTVYGDSRFWIGTRNGHAGDNRTAGTGPGGGLAASGACTVFRTLPQAANTIATASGSMGSFRSPGFASTTVHAERARLRPFTHQLSMIDTPVRSPGAEEGVERSSPNPVHRNRRWHCEMDESEEHQRQWLPGWGMALPQPMRRGALGLLSVVRQRARQAALPSGSRFVLVRDDA